MTILKDIVQLEWGFFQAVNNEGGRANCQDDRWSFALHRMAQLLTWSPELLESYYSDLLAALVASRNPMEEKYAYMMCDAAPEQYAVLRSALPKPSLLKQELVQEITEHLVAEQKRFAREYPNYSRGGRAILSKNDRDWTMSFETYLRGELLTYSEHTLKLYQKHLQALKKAGFSMPKMNMENIAKMCGFTSAEELEQRSAPTERNGMA